MSNNKPTHRLYAVVQRDKGKARWQEIGAAWSHKDGKGFSLKLSYLPLNGAEIVLREPLPEQSEATTAGNGGAP